MNLLVILRQPNYLTQKGFEFLQSFKARCFLRLQVVGIHILGPNAGEIIQGLAVAIRCGVTKEHFDDCAAWSR